MITRIITAQGCDLAPSFGDLSQSEKLKIQEIGHWIGKAEMILPHLLYNLDCGFLLSHMKTSQSYIKLLHIQYEREIEKKDHQGVLNKCAWLMLGVHPANFPK